MESVGSAERPAVAAPKGAKKSPPVRHPKRTRSSEALAPRRREKAPESATPEKRSDFLRRLSLPRAPPEPPAGLVPKTAGWLRTAPHFKGGAALTYGVTATHQMRLALRSQAEKKPATPQPSVSARSVSKSTPRSAKEAPSVRATPRRTLSRSANVSEEDSSIYLDPTPAPTSPAPAPRLELLRRRSEEAGGSMEVPATGESASAFFTSVEETELVPLRESSSSSSSARSVEGRRSAETSPRPEEDAAPNEVAAAVINPIQSSRSPFVSGGRMSSVPMASYEASASTAKPLTVGSSENPNDRDTYTADFSEAVTRASPTLNPYDTSEWQTSGESTPVSPHKPPIPTRSFESPSPRRRRTPQGSQSPGARARRLKMRSERTPRSSSYSLTSSSIEENPQEEEGATGVDSRNFYASSVMSSGTKVTPMTRGSTTKGSVFIPPLSGAHTDSVSSYMPTDPDNMSMMSGESFSDDFQ